MHPQRVFVRPHLDVDDHAVWRFVLVTVGLRVLVSGLRDVRTHEPRSGRMMSLLLRVHLLVATIWAIAAAARMSREPIDAASVVRALACCVFATLAWQLTAAGGPSASVATAGAVTLHAGGLLIGLEVPSWTRRIGAVLVSAALVGLAARLALPY